MATLVLVALRAVNSDADCMTRLAAVALILVACGGDDGGSPGTVDSSTPPRDGNPADVPGGVGEPPELQGITLLHNQVRAMVDTATPLPPLTWSNELAATAAAWVAQCKSTGGQLLDHNADRSVGHPYYVGENIYASSGTATAQGAVQAWAAEKAQYTYPNGYSPQTGHYTQLVWRDTREVGCALGDCPALQYGSTIVCDYGPGGNVGGQAPY